MFLAKMGALPPSSSVDGLVGGEGKERGTALLHSAAPMFSVKKKFISIILPNLLDAIMHPISPSELIFSIVGHKYN